MVLLRAVDLSVLSVPNVHKIELVSSKNVPIPVLVHVEQTQTVVSIITVLYVRVRMDTLEIHSPDAIQLLVRLEKKSNFTEQIIL